ncbi:hypothetical protein RND81_08G028800 [Saponaria officinalis]|uniref:non-specific serine/threonine protein kinase n=1 Tax=Saponaria officinalis TaxID=3572 RepID=A0AAW1J3M8_SAPOF
MHPKDRTLSAWRVPILLQTLNCLICISTSAYVDERYASCAPMSPACGPSHTLSYPFWDSSRPDYCGHPGFKLECQSDNLTIQIKNQSYNVLDVNYKSNIFRITKQQFSQTPCPESITQLTNSSIDFSLFNFTPSSENVTLFYDCFRKADKVLPNRFSCPPGNYISRPTMFVANKNYLSMDKKLEGELREICAIEIYLPVLQTNVIDLNDGVSDINDVVSKGFELTWVIDEGVCQDCLTSGGRCGYNQTLNQPICFCQDGAYDRSCAKFNVVLGQKKRKRDTVTGLGVVAVVSSVILIGILCFFYRRRWLKKNRSILQPVSEDDNPNTLSTASEPSESTYFGIKVFRYSELEGATNYFNPKKELGKGGFGTVYHGTLHDGCEVAVKRLHEKHKTKVEQFMNEIELLANLRHRNLVILYGCTSPRCKEGLLLVYEYVCNGTIADHIYGTKEALRLLSWSKRLRIAKETATALVYLHSSKVIHRDVKSHNILLDKDFSVKVADFGVSRLFPLDVTHVSTDPQGTPGYLDPEYFERCQLTEKSDVYSFGVVLAELISSKKAVDVSRGSDDISLRYMLMSKIQIGALDDFIDPLLGVESDDIKEEITAVAELAAQCLESTQVMRPSMEDVLERLLNIKGRND